MLRYIHLPPISQVPGWIVIVGETQRTYARLQPLWEGKISKVFDFYWCYNPLQDNEPFSSN